MFKRGHSGKSPVRPRRSLVLEELESRTLLSASPLDNLAAVPQILVTPASVSASPQVHGGRGSGSVTNPTPPPGAYTPSQISSAYGFNGTTFSNGTITGDGSGQTIAIVDAYNDPTIWSDLTTFDAQYGLSDPTLTVMSQNGTVLSTNGQSTGATPPSADPSGGWELEEALDVEWAHAIAPGANIVLVEANSSSLSNLMQAVQTAANNASVVSMSWGSREFSSETNYDSYFTQPNVTYVASSGDNGAPPSYPAVSPNVLAVGGTSLTLNGSTYASESAWSDSGGGISRYENLPSYQTDTYSNGATTATSTKRMSPDVAYDANPNTGFAVYDSTPYSPYYPYRFGAQSGWFQVGGTSAGAPQWAALVAIADQGRALDGESPLSGGSQTLPAIYNMSSSDFHNITSGGNNRYSAGTGYNLVTGRGSPIANLVVNALVNAGPSGSVPSGAAHTSGPSSSTSPAVSTVGAAGTNPESVSGAASITGFTFTTAAATESAILAQPTQTLAVAFFEFDLTSATTLTFGTGQASAAPGANIASQTSATLPGWQIYAPGPKSISTPSEALGTSPFRSQSLDAMPMTGPDGASPGGDGPLVPLPPFLVPESGYIHRGLIPAVSAQGRSEETLAGDTCFVDEASLALITEEILAAASGDYGERIRLRDPSLALLGILVSSMWMTPDAVEQFSRRRQNLPQIPR
jgi:subtilase family serine protease